MFTLAACGAKTNKSGSQNNDTQNNTADTDKNTSENTSDSDSSSESQSSEEANDTLSRVRKAGKIIVGTSADYAPYEFHTIIDGKDTIVGFDIEIAKEIAKDLGVELEIQDMSFDGLLQALNSDKVDFVIAGMTPNEERKKSVDFTDIYYTAQQGVMVRAEDKDKYKTIEDLKGKKVGAQSTTIQEGIVKEQMPESQLVSLTKIPDLVMELLNKKVEAIVVELPVAKGYVANNGKLAISDIKVQDDTGGSAIAVKKGNPELVELMNNTLKRLQEDGSIDRFVAEANEMNVVEN
ncbi:MAG TPA: transporter substrate-binding domain-containing protein [Clostridiaceae bacterium]|nr:transporter substrate-binding domain-containing protein [Clostridiaceae bacterium]